MVKKTWKTPMLEVLDVSMTMNGPGNANVDCFDVGGHPGQGNNHPGMSNASCLDGSGGGHFDS